MIKIKYITCGTCRTTSDCFLHDDCLFDTNPFCREYDWFVLYDDMPREDCGSIVREIESLACPASHTILITQEPPSIKIYPRCFTGQFGYVLTTQLQDTLPHPRAWLSCGALHPQNGRSWEEDKRMLCYEKTQLLSTVCSAKKMKHTEHFARFSLTRYLAQHLPEMHWYGRGVLPLENKFEALDSYKYHIAVENYLHPYHWTDKIIDPLLSHCLTFYAGDPRLAEFLPPESFIPIPLDDFSLALRIIREAIDNNEYEKRLPAILEARRLLVEKYNTRQRVVDIIHRHQDSSLRDCTSGCIAGRHALRRNLWNLCGEAMELLRYKWRPFCVAGDEDV